MKTLTGARALEAIHRLALSEGQKEKHEKEETKKVSKKTMKRLKEIGKALKSLVLCMGHVDYQIESKKRKRKMAKTKAGEEN